MKTKTRENQIWTRGKTPAACAALLLGLAGCGGSGDSAEPPISPAQIQILSSKAEHVSGGDALIEVSVPERAQSADVVVSVNGVPVTDRLTSVSGTNRLRGRVDGLVSGANAVEVKVAQKNGPGSVASLSLVNHPSTGPILAGPLQTPYECRTVESGLGEATDDNCSAARQISWFYRTNTASASFKPLADPLSRPADMASTTTNAGTSVPYIVRVDSGVIGRTIYRIAVLDEPTAATTAPEQYRPSTGWNGKLFVRFEGGAGTQYNQGVNQATTPLGMEFALSRGFAVMVSTELVNGARGNAVLQGETLMMLKEYFIERYGVPKWTVGSGGSGGGIQQLVISEMYPGLLDGLQPARPFQDSVVSDNTDCRPLLKAYASDPGYFTPAKRQAIDGYTLGTCAGWDRSLLNKEVAAYAPGCALKDTSKVYHPVTNPTGARCTTQDLRVNIYGRDPATGFARKTYDNVGLQYGLVALNRGEISVEDFLRVNERAGGYDVDGNLVVERSVADPIAIQRAGESGLINRYTQLGALPILNFRRYTDSSGDIHDRQRDFTIRARLEAATGSSDNHVIWTTAPSGYYVEELALDTMNTWLDALAADPAPHNHAKVVRNKPAVARDACWDNTGTRYDEQAAQSGGNCATMYPVHSNPRLAAGVPLTSEVLKCQLRPVNFNDYTQTFDAAQQARMQAAFPAGVCDWSKPGVGNTPMKGTYLKW